MFHEIYNRVSGHAIAHTLIIGLAGNRLCLYALLGTPETGK